MPPFLKGPIKQIKSGDFVDTFVESNLEDTILDFNNVSKLVNRKKKKDDILVINYV